MKNSLKNVFPLDVKTGFHCLKGKKLKGNGSH